jgi:hypothetical protein
VSDESFRIELGLRQAALEVQIAALSEKAILRFVETCELRDR